MSLIKTLYQSDKKLFRLICRFNANPAEYIHPSHLSDYLSARGVAKMKKSPEGVTALSRYITKEYNFSEVPFIDVKTNTQRLALLGSTHLTKLVMFAGAAYYSENITQVIQKDVVLKLKKTIGEDAYLFAVKRAPFILRAKPHLANLSANPANLEEGVPEAGYRLLEICFNKEPEALTKCIQLHFPKDCYWDFNQDLTEGLKDQIFTFLYQILVKEISPALKSCFI